MEIVIDIPEEMYKEYISVNLGRGNGKNITYNLLNAIKKGTPLPEHHGRLIDADELHHKMGEWLKPQKADETVMVALDDIAISTMMEIEDAPTIIEADRRE